jgi:hypothetical protein
MGEAVPDSWVYHYIHYYNYGTDFSRLQKAYDINPDVSDLYWEFMKEYELRGETENKKVFSEILYNSKDISKGVLNINYNMLISTESNSILFTNGDNDTYPAWILQEVKGVRDDVLILNVHAIFGDKEYLQTKLNDKGLEIDIALLPESQIDQFLLELILMIREKYSQFPIHIAQTVYEGYYKKFIEDLYLTGFVYTFSKTPLEDNAIHKNIFESKLRLDYLDNEWYSDQHISEPLVNQMNLYYFESFKKLVKYYYSLNDMESVKKWKEKALRLAKRVNDDTLIKTIESDW